LEYNLVKLPDFSTRW